MFSDSNAYTFRGFSSSPAKLNRVRQMSTRFYKEEVGFVSCSFAIDVSPLFALSAFTGASKKASHLAHSRNPQKSKFKSTRSKIKRRLDKSQSALYKEEVGFEPTVRVNVRQFSRLLQSTALALLQSIGCILIIPDKYSLSSVIYIK